MSRQNLTPVNIPAYDSNPNFPNPRIGDAYYNTVSLGLFVYNGSDWVPASSGTGGGASPINPFSFWVGSN
jgi:hypothetical protein